MSKPHSNNDDDDSNNKRQKLKDDNNDVETLSTLSETVAATITTTKSSTVTAIALLTDTIIFSGHRDGTIRRWNMKNTKTSTNETSSTWTCTKNRQPDWIITSACVNLTDHEIYGAEEKLGIAGLVVRKDRQNSGSSNDDDDASTSPHFLYSYNHQREDMRKDVNGIPQKVMIWDATTGERLNALMIDVGRCSYTGMFANPLISCLVFCRLLVDDVSLPSTSSLTATTTTTTTTSDNNNNNCDLPRNVEKVWTDAIIVALQATCEIADNSQDDRDLVTTSTTDTTATKEGDRHVHTPPNSTTQVAAKKRPKVVTGNIVPFYEHTRKRMSPWSAVGGFVRALAVTTDEDDNNTIISVTETARSSIVVATSATTALHSSDSVNVDTTRPTTGSTTMNKEGTNDGGQASNILIWDTSCPGTILYNFSLVEPKFRSTTQDRFYENVYALTLSNCNQFLLLSMANVSKDDGSSVHAVVRLSFSGKRSPDDPVVTNDVSIVGWYTSLLEEKATSHRGDWIIKASRRSGKVDKTDVDGKFLNELTMYSFTELLTIIESDGTANTNLDVQKLNATKLFAPPTTDMDLSTIVIGQSHVITGYDNGDVRLTNIPSSTIDDDVITSFANSTTGSNEHVSCSTAPMGLRGVPCPHLSSTANNVNLQNKCTIM